MLRIRMPDSAINPTSALMPNGCWNRIKVGTTPISPSGLVRNTITIAEIEAGIARAVRIGASSKAPALRRWLAAVEHFYASRILALADEGRIEARGNLEDPKAGEIRLASKPGAE